MRRDEIKIFPGSTDAHLNRLRQFPDSPPPIAHEHSGESAAQPPLDYTSPETGRRWRTARWNNFARELAGSVSNAMVLIAVVITALVLGVPLRAWTVITIVGVLAMLLVGILLLVHIINRWLHRS